MAAFCDRSLSLIPDDEDAGGGFDDVIGDGLKLVDLEYSVDLGEEAFEEAEVAARDAFDRGDGLRVGEVVGVEVSAEAFPVAVAVAHLRRGRVMNEAFIVTKEHRRFTEFANAVRKERTIGICHDVAGDGDGKTNSARRYANWDALEPSRHRELAAESDHRTPPKSAKSHNRTLSATESCVIWGTINGHFPTVTAIELTAGRRNAV